jgi:hypothetical protein
MAKQKQSSKTATPAKGGSDRPNQKAFKKRPKMFDATKRRLVTGGTK